MKKPCANCPHKIKCQIHKYKKDIKNKKKQDYFKDLYSERSIKEYKQMSLFDDMPLSDESAF